MLNKIPTYKDVAEAHQLIAPFINRTPVLTSSTFNKMFDCQLYFKCENLQKVGAFKFRGATHAVLRLTDAEAKNGVATHSSGNHAAALALAARNRGIKAYIVMPSNSPEVKVKAVKEYGGIITFCPPTLEARESFLNEILNNTGATFIHPYNNYHVIAGQGTAAKELLEEIPELDIIVAPVGGGGLLSGTLLSAHSIRPGIKVYAAEPKDADDAWQSFRAKKLIPQIHTNTIADGLRTSLGDITFDIISRLAEDVLCVTEEEIIRHMRMIWERMKIIVEPSSAVTLAAIASNQPLFAKKKVGIIFSGGNVDLDELSQILKTNI